MKKNVHPAAAGILILIVLCVAAGVFNYVYRDPTEGKNKPLDDSNSIMLKSGRRLPIMAGGGPPKPAAGTPKPTDPAKPGAQVKPGDPAKPTDTSQSPEDGTTTPPAKKGADGSE